MTHTPGPWETHVSQDATGYPCYFIHGVSGDAKRDTSNLLANARLIAAAPDLLAALKRARRAVYAIAESSHLLEGFGPRIRTAPDDDLELLDAAIAKAEGTS